LFDQLMKQPPACVNQADSWCSWVHDLTGSNWLAASADWLLAKPLKILLILVVACVVRWLAKRAIDHMTAGKVPKRLQPLRERARVPRVAHNNERRRQRAKTIGSVLNSVASFVVFGLAVILILGELGLNLAPIIASAGVLGLALGFGAQNLVRDFLSGMFMMAEDQYGVGDTVDVGEAIGTVESVGLRVTTLRDMQGTVWYVRNGEVLRVGNFSQGYAVAVVDVPIGYETDVDKALEIIGRTLTTAVGHDSMSEDVLEEPQLLGIDSVTAEAMTVRSTVKVRPGKQWAIQRSLRGKMIDALNDSGIRPPLSRLVSPKSE
jgi:small conductance mechanosensitive channel